MGGVGSGGNRPGAGRKKKDAAARALDGNAGHRGRVLPHPSVPPQVSAPPPAAVDIDEADAPNDLTIEERRVWLMMAPFATANGTLTKAWAFAFALLCRNIALERRYASSVTEAGGPSHRGVIQIVDRELLRFNLAPLGKPAESEDAKPAVDPLKAKYFGA